MRQPLVYVVDDDPSILSALRRVLSAAGHEVVCFLDAESFVEQQNPDAPGCAVVDLDLPGMNGLEIPRQLASTGSNRSLIYLSGKGDIPASVRAMKLGAVDFLTKPVPSAVLLDAVATAVERDAAAREQNERVKSVDERLGRLTPRERQVLGLVVEGLLNKQIAFQLGTVEKTVKVHRARMMAKMEVHTVADLVRMMTLYRESAGEPAHSQESSLDEDDVDTDSYSGEFN
ncbi:MAG TPA: response regulator [Rhizobiaceae bacterium]|nr:response regulator [Rhizobiaceae bacterium]